jgi:hypothetical protein
MSRGAEEIMITPPISVPVIPAPPSELLADALYVKNRSTTQDIVKEVHTAIARKMVR